MSTLIQRLVPAGAAISAVSTVLCCLPLPFAGAIGLAGLGVALTPYRYCLMAASVALLGTGFVQAYRHPRACRQSAANLAILWISALVVVAVLLLPQLLATLLADWFS